MTNTKAFENLLARMATDAEFARSVQDDPIRYGLTGEELALVRGTRLDTAGLLDPAVGVEPCGLEMRGPDAVRHFGGRFGDHGLMPYVDGSVSPVLRGIEPVWNKW